MPGRPWCPAARERARFSAAWISTEGLTVSYAVGRSAPFACDGVLVNRRWVLCGGGSAHFRDVPAQAAWVLVDHHSYWVSYRTTGRRLLRISGLRGIERGRFRVKLAYLDERGRTLRVRRAMGYVAG